jgi:hypothetical protein
MITKAIRLNSAKLGRSIASKPCGQQAVRKLAEAALPDTHPVSGPHTHSLASRLLRHGLRVTRFGLRIFDRVSNIALAAGVTGAATIPLALTAHSAPLISLSLGATLIGAGTAFFFGPDTTSAVFDGLSEEAVLREWLLNPQHPHSVYADYFAAHLPTEHPVIILEQDDDNDPLREVAYTRPLDERLREYLRPLYLDLILNGSDQECQAVAQYFYFNDRNTLHELQEDLARGAPHSEARMHAERILTLIWKPRNP